MMTHRAFGFGPLVIAFALVEPADAVVLEPGDFGFACWFSRFLPIKNNQISNEPRHTERESALGINYLLSGVLHKW